MKSAAGVPGRFIDSLSSVCRARTLSISAMQGLSVNARSAAAYSSSLRIGDQGS